MSFNVHAENQIFCAAVALAATPGPGVAKLLLGLASPCGAPGGWRCVAEAKSFLLMPDEIRSWCTPRTSNYVREIYYVPIGWRCQSNVISAVLHGQVFDFKNKNVILKMPYSALSRTFTTRLSAFFICFLRTSAYAPCVKNCHSIQSPLYPFCRRLHRCGARYA
jgi:hypothetical protein